MIPTLVLSYAVFALFLAVVALFANSVVATGVFHDGPMLLALFLLAPLLAGWAIVVGMAVSVRASEVRVAQQLGMLGQLSSGGFDHSAGGRRCQSDLLIALAFAVGLLMVDIRLLRFVSRMFDRERLMTGAKAV